ncbi:MAG: hypothetical protein PHW42_05625 [Patescibacteria group bacterium]|nr:hypothetical protein [Patescibacteria group bacterium]
MDTKNKLKIGLIAILILLISGVTNAYTSYYDNYYRGNIYTNTPTTTIVSGNQVYRTYEYSSPSDYNEYSQQVYYPANYIYQYRNYYPTYYPTPSMYYAGYEQVYPTTYSAYGIYNYYRTYNTYVGNYYPLAYANINIGIY